MSAKLAKQQYLGILMEQLGNCDDDGVLDSSADDILRETADYLDIAISEAQLEAVENIIDSIKITDVPPEESFGNVAKGQIFVAGQMNVLFRLNERREELRKAAGKGE